MNIGSHNTMTYLKPKKWYLYPFQFIARCQSKTIEEQYALGARYFDLRIAFTKDGTPEFRHGLMAYKGNVYDALQFLNSKPGPIVRILLEVNSKTDTVLNRSRFIDFCRYISKRYININFVGGNAKTDWSQVYKFDNYDYTYIDKYASGETKIKLDDLWPWLYAKVYNSKSKKETKDVDFMILDFIQIG